MEQTPLCPHSRSITFGEIKMSFALYMVGFLIFLGGVIWGAVVAGVPHLYIGIGSLIILGIGIFSAVSKTRGKDPS
jgi:ABC-type multidrug transport system permease subunit